MGKAFLNSLVSVTHQDIFPFLEKLQMTFILSFPSKPMQLEAVEDPGKVL
jgi:hypothetical protein